jgi:general secretion pathway protein D
MKKGTMRAVVALVCTGACLVGTTARADPWRGATAPAKRWPAARQPPAPPPAVPNRGPADPPPPAFTDADFNTCHKLPRGKHLLPVSLKPETDVDHLVAWLSSITCKAFVYSGALTAHNRNVTIVVPALVTPAEAYRLVLDALNSVGLTLQPSGGFFQIIETQHARSKSIPLYGYDGHRLRYRHPPAGG